MAQPDPDPIPIPDPDTKNSFYARYGRPIGMFSSFINSIFHNPFEYYVFETYDPNKTNSSEVKILKTDFDNNHQNLIGRKLTSRYPYKIQQDGV